MNRKSLALMVLGLALPTLTGCVSPAHIGPTRTVRQGLNLAAEVNVTHTNRSTYGALDYTAGFGNGWGTVETKSFADAVADRLAESGLVTVIHGRRKADVQIDVKLHTACTTTGGQKAFRVLMGIGTLDIYPFLGGPFPTQGEWRLTADVYPTDAPEMRHTYTRNGVYKVWSPMYTILSSDAEELGRSVTGGLSDLIEDIAKDMGTIRTEVATVKSQQQERLRAAAAPRPAEAIAAAPAPQARAAPSAIWQREKFKSACLLAVGVGQAKYESVPSLPFAIKDARRVHEWFVSPTGAGAPASDARLLLNEQATRENLFTEIDWLRRNAMPEDAVVFYFAGHGAPELAPDGQSVDAKYLILYDTNPQNLFATAVPLDELTRRLEFVKANVQVVVLEACYTGPVGQKVLAATPTADLQIRPRAIQDMGGKRGRIILTASSGRQMAIGSDEIGGGLFTHYLLKSLGDGHRRLMQDCFEEMRDNVRRAANRLGSTQEPQKFGEANVDVVFRPEERPTK